jgi:catechol 2,3-dioxygenase-like lactoylglutathione lyase family enzyme
MRFIIMCSTTASSKSNEQAITTAGIHHLGLTVPNLQQAVDFFIEQLNFEKVGEKPAYPAIFVSDGSIMLTLWQAKDADNMVAFNRQNNVGLHHFALRVSNLEELQALHAKFLKLDDVQIEFAPEPLGDTGIHHMMCYIPGGIRLELINA